MFLHYNIYVKKDALVDATIGKEGTAANTNQKNISRVIFDNLWYHTCFFAACCAAGCLHYSVFGCCIIAKYYVITEVKPNE